MTTPATARGMPNSSRARLARLISSARPSAFGNSTTAIVARNSRMAAPGSITGQIGNSVLLSSEVARKHLLALQREDDADERATRPRSPRRYRRARPWPDAARPMADRPRCADDGEMLQVALRPAPVADDEIGEARRHALEGAVERRRHVHAPAGALEQHGLDEVVAHDVAAERRPGPGRSGRPAEPANATVRMMALWPQ